ncbi:MAG: hypothetical protein ACJ8G1_19035 [Vitreoscilla sp.]
MKYTQAFIALGATYSSSKPSQRLAVNKSAGIFAFWGSSAQVRGDGWSAEGRHIRVTREVRGPWTQTRGGQLFYRALLRACREGVLVKVVKYWMADDSNRPVTGESAAEPMMNGGSAMLGQVIIEPADAKLPEEIRTIEVLLMPAATAVDGSESELRLYTEVTCRGVPSMFRLIRAKNVTIESTEIPRLHSILTVRLMQRLKENFPADELRAEHGLRGQQSRADITRQEAGTGKLHIYEVKTSTDRANCERASVGQLLEYCAAATDSGFTVASITTVGINGTAMWIGRRAIPELSVPWHYMALEEL